jgi:predicted permease
MLSDLLFRLRALFRRRAVEAELDEELRFHFERQVEKFLASGLPREEATRRARLAFGGFDQVKESCRRARGVDFLETSLQDLRFGLRTLRKDPTFSVIAVVTLALGIGANTALFSIVNGVLINPLPYPHPERLVRLHESKPNFDAGSIPYPNFRDWQKQNHSFSAVAISRNVSFVLSGRGDPERLKGELITADFLPLLGVKPLLGRGLAPGEDEIGAAPVALIGEELWKRRFGSAPGVLGQTLILNGKAYAIAGVLPAGFDLPVPSFRPGDVYVPFGQWDHPLLRKRNAGLGIHGIGLLAPGVTIDQARADMDRVTRNLALAYPDADKGIGAKLAPLKQEMVGDVQPFLLLLLSAVGFVLLIACVNVANLLLARSTHRARELALRAALGASQGRVIRQLLTESVLLAAAGGGLGLLMAAWGTRAALAALPSALPRAAEIGLDARVLVFTLAVSLAAGILFGLVPAWKASQADPHQTLKEGGRGASGGRRRAQDLFVLAEIAMALVLVIGAGLMIRSLAVLWSASPGFRPDHVLKFGFTMPASAKTASPAVIRAALRELDADLAAVPGLEAVSLSDGALPMDSDDEQLFWLAGRPKPASEDAMSWAVSYMVEPDYLKVMGIPLERGRFFTPHDDERSPLVAVVDDVFARKFFAAEDPIHKRLELNGGAGQAEIVGVVGHVKQWGLAEDDTHPLRAQLYLAFRQMPDARVAFAPGADVVVRATGERAALVEAVRRVAKGMNGVVYGAQTMDELVSRSLAARRFSMILLGLFAALAVVLASVGIYGVIAYLVGHKTQEIGVRLALGAQRGDVLALVLSEGLKMAVIGVAMGLAAALALTRLMAKLLYGVSATDPPTFAGVAIVVTMVALAACYIPARRALRVDPMVALRCE